MYALLYIDLGFAVVVRADESFEPIETSQDGFRFLIHAPYKSGITPGNRDFLEGLPLVDVAHQLPPLDPQPTRVALDDHPATVADGICVEIHGAGLTRERGAEERAVPLAFEIANRFLERIRAVAQSPMVRPVQPEFVFWYLKYLDDDGSEFEADPELARGRFATPWHLPGMPLLRADGMWSQVRDLPDDYRVPPWEALFLDARLLLESQRLRPEVGPALVLAASAIETRIDDLLEVLVDRHGGPVRPLWSWLTARDQWWREPSFSEKLSVVLESLSGRSLKNDNELWAAFQNLKEARNMYVHEGVARVGRNPVTSERAGQLLGKVREILDWLEADLPDGERRPRYEREHRFQIHRELTSDAEVADQGGTSEDGPGG
jgi:hypothetical protein